MGRTILVSLYLMGVVIRKIITTNKLSVKELIEEKKTSDLIIGLIFTILLICIVNYFGIRF